MQSPSLVMCECSLSGRGQSHVSQFYILDLGNFVTEVVGVQVLPTSTASLWLHLRRSSASWLHRHVYYTLVCCIPQTLLYTSTFLDLSYKLFLHCYAAVGKNSTDTSRRAVRLR